METEKKRAPNFSASEKELLTNIILEFKGIIENKKTDALTWRDKDTAWENITNIFNSQNPEGVHRSKDSLRKSYDNLKRALRKDVADEKRELYKTGGGLPDNKILCKAGHSQTLLNIVNHKTVFGLKSVYDGGQNKTNTNEDSKTTNIQSEHSYTEPKSSDVALSAEVQSPIASTSKSPMTWIKATASDLKRPATKELQNHWLKRRRPAIQQPASQLVDEYASLAKIKQEVFEAEKSYKERKQEREEILFELEKTKLELDIKIRQLQLKNCRNNMFFIFNKMFIKNN